VLFHVKGNARIERFRVDVQADAAGPSPIRVLDLVDGLQLINRDNLAVIGAADGIEKLQLDAVCSSQAVDPNHILILRSTASQVPIPAPTVELLGHK